MESGPSKYNNLKTKFMLLMFSPLRYETKPQKALFVNYASTNLYLQMANMSGMKMTNSLQNLLHIVNTIGFCERLLSNNSIEKHTSIDTEKTGQYYNV